MAMFTWGTAARAILMTGAALLLSCRDAYVHLELVDDQPTQQELGRVLSVEAYSSDAPHLRLSVRGGKLARPGMEAGTGPFCEHLFEDELDVVYFVFADNVEAVVTGQLVDGNEDCAKANPMGPSMSLVIEEGGDGDGGAGGSGGGAGGGEGAGGGGAGGGGTGGAGGGGTGGAPGAGGAGGAGGGS